MLFFGVVACSGIVAWVVWNWVIFGEPTNFQSGDYAKPSLWVSRGEPAVGDWGAAARTYLYAMRYDMGWIALGIGLAGVLLYLVRNRVVQGSLAPYALLVFLPFFVSTLQSAQRPLHVPEVGGLDLYNVRFGFVMVLAVAVFGGYLVDDLRHRVAKRSAPVAGFAAAGLVMVALAVVPGTATRSEAVAFRASPAEQANTAASTWLRRHYDGGLVLMESFGNESVTFGSQIPTEQIVYEGSFRKWEPALAHPASHHIRWIYLRTTPGTEDDPAGALAGTRQLATDYELVYEDADRQIYRREEDR
jgi:hypothetical protein